MYVMCVCAASRRAWALARRMFLHGVYFCTTYIFTVTGSFAGIRARTIAAARVTRMKQTLCPAASHFFRVTVSANASRRT